MFLYISFPILFYLYEMTNLPMKEHVVNKVKEKELEEVVEVLPEVATAKAKPTTPVTDATFKSTSVALIEKLLQFSTPRLDVKIVNVLFLEGKRKTVLFFL